MAEKENIGIHDKRLEVKTSINEPDILFRDVRDCAVDIYGFSDVFPVFRRIPEKDAARVNSMIEVASRKACGGRLRFATDSRYVALRAVEPLKCGYPHMSFLGVAGFDMYVQKGDQETYWGSFIPPLDMEDSFESVLYFPDAKMREITIYFPLYTRVSKVELGLQEQAQLKPGRKYRINKPVVLYGSSITQGACASRPGNSYSATLSRWLDFDFINLGFSGRALGESEMAQYLASLDASAFLLDYDANAPDVAHLQATHSNMYQIIRNAHPNTPIIFISGTPKASWDTPEEEQIQRENVVLHTFEEAKSAGDNQVWMVKGQEIFAAFGGGSCLVDGAHPNDLGFYAMAKAIAPVLREALESRG